MEKLTMETKKGIMEDFFAGAAGPDFLAWLEEQGFYKAPAARKNHGNREGGLFDHSLQVAYELIKLTNGMQLKWQRKQSPAVIGMLHDICKLDDYIIVDGKEIIGQQADGSPQRRKEAEYNPERVWPGHGEKSLIMLMGHIKLTDEEKICIRYHMGAYAGQQEWEFYSRAARKYPNLLYVHLADMMASQVMGV